MLSPSASVQRVAVPSDQVHMAAPNAASCCFRQFTRQLPAQEAASAANSQLVRGGVKLAADTIIRIWVLEVIRKNIKCEKFVLRLYTASSAARMWQHLIATDASQRHVYEIIQEGWACHMYFDLEVEGPGVDFKAACAALDTLIRIITELCRCALPLACSGICSL